MSDDTRYGKFPFGASSVNWTVVESIFLTPSGVSTSVNVDSALEAFFESDSCLNVYTTSSAVIGAPVLNLTFGRSLKVHTLPSPLWPQLSASIGSNASLRLLSKIRNSPVWLSITRPPASATVSGLIAADGVTEPTFNVPPAVGAGPLVALELAAPAEDDDDELPHAANTVPSSVVDIPIMLPRRRN